MRKRLPLRADPELPRREDEAFLGPAHYLQLMTVDFTGIYSVYLAAKDERLKMTRLSMSLLSAPFAAAVALAGARVVDPASLTSWSTVPWYIFALVAAFGLLSILPFLRLIEAVSAHMRAARAINNFRLLYTARLKDQFEEMNWTPNLPVDPRYPETYAPLAWPGVNVMMLAVVNGVYIALGLLGLSGTEPSASLLSVVIGLIALVHYLMYYVRANVSRRRRLPSNPYQFPNVET
ncbi:hypothetical protein Misp01_41580 [Microtetraspora sp. NBRC 13810]|uniref:hypothetical protein n=1 Tax=Microtetraspora sp. NBRC 13810 TaxID=3030990 RepID=UPI002555D051|nr:hypothetical protein [Microtetraspora sp. NBRC 13810]GLW09029.1 hypothetical protein Misp01_41580 [Microtetraspora sp. NBRC 13810]